MSHLLLVAPEPEKSAAGHRELTEAQVLLKQRWGIPFVLVLTRPDAQKNRKGLHANRLCLQVSGVHHARQNLHPAQPKLRRGSRKGLAFSTAHWLRVMGFLPRMRRGLNWKRSAKVFSKCSMKLRTLAGVLRLAGRTARIGHVRSNGLRRRTTVPSLSSAAKSHAGAWAVPKCSRTAILTCSILLVRKTPVGITRFTACTVTPPGLTFAPQTHPTRPSTPAEQSVPALCPRRPFRRPVHSR
jgi:hypothetical protein